MFCDLASYTVLTEVHGDEDAADLVADYAQRTRRLLPEYGAEEVKTIGDALMLRVEEPAKAIELGLRITADAASEHGLPGVGVGADYGPAAERGGDYFGRTVNVAARVSALCGVDEVLATAALRDAAGDLEGVEWIERGEEVLKNVSEPLMVFEALAAGRAAHRLATDPVCRMAIDPDRGAGQLLHDGHRYFFCSLECAGRFAADPTRYT